MLCLPYLRQIFMTIFEGEPDVQRSTRLSTIPVFGMINFKYFAVDLYTVILS